MDDDTALLTVAELPQVGERRLCRIEEEARRTRTPLAQLAEVPAERLRREFGLPAAAVQRLLAAPAWHAGRCAALAAQLRAGGVRLCRRGDEHYPPGWTRRAEPPPPLAYLYGNTALLGAPAAAVLSSRLLGGTTITATLCLVRAAAAAGFALAVGGMKSTHRIAAVAARALGAARLVVLDRGILSAFAGDLGHDPFGFGPRHPPFDARRSLVLSPFRAEDHAVPRSGRRRDELVAALAEILLVVQARPGGEIERLCRRALARGQTVLLWQGHHPGLLAAGAQAVDAEEAAGRLRALHRAETERLGEERQKAKSKRQKAKVPPPP